MFMQEDNRRFSHNLYCRANEDQTEFSKQSGNDSGPQTGDRMAHRGAKQLGREILTTITTRSKSKRAQTRTHILWAIFLYGLLQSAANLPPDNNSSHLLKLQEKAPTIFKTVIESSPNEESPNYGCNNVSKLKQQLCSSASTTSEPRAKIQEGQDEGSLIKSTQQQQQPLFLKSLPSVIHSSLLQIFDKLTTNNYIINGRRQLRSLVGGPRIWMAEAAATAQQQSSERGIVVLNSTNFSHELLQNRHPFPHLKLIEFYVAYCSFCSKFKATYANLAKEIYSWRNVIRPSVIDVSTNLPVANSWRVKTVPTLCVYPPPAAQLASKIDKQLFKITKKQNDDHKSSEDDALDYLYNEYNAAKPMVLPLEPSTYLNNIPQFKTVLLEYINSYVRSSTSPSDGNSSSSNYIPETWPNLRPVGDESLAKLLANHPRQELFLLIQGPAHQSQPAQANVAFQVMLELSSTASWRAVRYVKASENKALVEDVILQLKKLSRQSVDRINEQVEILQNFLTLQPQPGKGNIVLIHTDDLQSLVKMEGSSFASIRATTGQDLLDAEQHSLSSSSEHGVNHRAKRNADHHGRGRRSLPLMETLTSDLEVELIAKHISHTYIETKEDRKFIRSINGIYRDISMEQDMHAQQLEETTSKPSADSPPTSLATPQRQMSSSPAPIPTRMEAPLRANYVDDDDDDGKESKESILTKLHNLLFVRDGQSTDPDSLSRASSGDYFDKIKAIRYILFNEIPRTSFADKSPSEQQEKLNNLLNLVTVIKSYFPMTDSSSIQFMDGVHTYLLKQQSKLLSVNSQQPDEQQQQRGLVFDTRAFRQELKRLESEDKRLPEVKEFKHCAKGGYPCALWRLFHTLTAFEYKKLNQIRLIPSQPTSTGLQQQQQQQLQAAELISSSSNVAPIQEPTNIGISDLSTINSTSVMINSDSDVPSPGERLVSPPSTTTSLSLTIVGPSTSSSANGNQKRISEADLPNPVLLVMRDYITNFFGCTECSRNFQQESADLSLERIRHQEPAEFSILWLWETHNRVNKRLSVDNSTNPPDNPKMWFPSYEQCSKCYKKPPSFLRDQSIAKDGPAAIFYESIEWNRQEILEFLVSEYTKQPMDRPTGNLFADHLGSDYMYILAGCVCLLVLALLLSSFTRYVERQRRHKATLLNGNAAHYTLELQ